MLIEKRPTSRGSRQYHNLGGTPTYRSWYSMIDRCLNTDNASFKHYGAKGVKVCDRWLDINNFVSDMGLRPAGMTIDRIDYSKGYEPGNCRWATLLEQQRNRSFVKCSMEKAEKARNLAAAGCTQRKIADEIGVSQSVVSRILSGLIWK